MNINNQILDYCLREWKKTFSGINSYDVATRLNIAHERVREAFKIYKKKNMGTLNEDVVLHTLKIPQDSKQADEIAVTIFYPSKESLEMKYKSDTEEEEPQEFKKRLRLGHQCSDLSYFSPSVLQKYLSSPEKYNIQSSLCGGFISSNENYLSNLSEKQKKKEQINIIRYGKRKISDGKQAITGILEDLSKLPEADQRHWHLAEIEDPDISLFDPDYHKFHLKFYNSTSVNMYNPLQGICETLKKINALSNVGKLFKNINSDDLKYPVNKKYDDFCSSCDKLYKVIGPENMSSDILQKYLSKNYNYQKEDFIDTKLGQPLTNEQLFRKLLNEVGFLTCSVDKLIREINNHKIPQDHRILTSRFKSPDYLTEYKKLCQSLLISFNILYQILNKDMSPLSDGLQ